MGKFNNNSCIILNDSHRHRTMFWETHFSPAKAGVDTFQGPPGHPGMAMEPSRLKSNGRTCLLRFELDEGVIFINVTSRNFLKIVCKRTLQHFDFTDFTIARKVLESMHMLIKCTNKIKFDAHLE